MLLSLIFRLRRLYGFLALAVDYAAYYFIRAMFVSYLRLRHTMPIFSFILRHHALDIC